MALGATGCIYIGPVTLLEDENVPPEIVGHTQDANCELQDTGLENPVLCVTHEEYPVFVIADDQDDDALSFFWWASRSGWIENAVASAADDKQSSLVKLSPSEMVDGETLECRVDDGSNTDVKVIWTLVVN